MGGRKLFEVLSKFMVKHAIKMGRDAFFEVLSIHNLLVKIRKKRAITTNSFHHYNRYKNMIKNFVPIRPNQLWVSDITYWKIETGFVYLSLITDTFSHKVVGYNLALTLEAIESIKALKMALNDAKLTENEYFDLIHHSDRGSQYCCDAYVKLLKDKQIKISMTESSEPTDNAIAERINGILKNEYLECYQVKNIEEAQKLLDSVILLYNQERPHMSIGNQTPNEIHHSKQPKAPIKLWKNYYIKKARKEVEVS